MKINTIIIGLFLVFMLIVSGCAQQQPPNCEGDWIEYQGNCCLDANYNYECDVLEKDDGKLDCIDDGDCREGAFCNQGICEKMGWSKPKPKEN